MWKSLNILYQNHCQHAIFFVLYLTDIYKMYLFLVFFIDRSASQRSVTIMTDFVEQAMQQYDKQGCLHEQFVKQAKSTPDTVAVVTHTGHKVTKKLAPFTAWL